MRTSRISSWLLPCLTVSVLFWNSGLSAGEITLMDGTVLKGGYPVTLSTVDPRAPRPDPKKLSNQAIVYLAESSAVRFYVPRLQIKALDRDTDLRPTERFKLPRTKRSRTKPIDQVGGQLEATNWDGFGRRRVSFRAGDKKLDLMQEIIEITPKYAKVSAVDYIWEFGIPTATIPLETLDQILHQATKRDNPDDRFAIVRFYLEGDFYQLAQHELMTIRQDFPTHAAQVDELTKQLKQYLADQALNMLAERREAGQYQLAYDTAKKFLSLNIPDISPATIQKLKQSISDTDTQRLKIEEIREILGQLEATLPPEQAIEVAPMRRVIAENLHPLNIDRLAAFVTFAEAENRKPPEKLALALTGWVLGADQADTDLKVAIRLWQARALMLDYLRAEDTDERATIAEKIAEIESVGPKQVVRMLTLMSPRIETPDATGGTPFKIEVEQRTNSGPVVRYEVLLPLEYHPARSYPAIVVLHAEGMESQAEMKWWARQAQRFGYVIIAPDYMDPKQRAYDYSAEAHHTVLQSINDARQRFNIDSDRIFLGGHGGGGDATFDIGYSHPDLFAGIMPITALCEKVSALYWENARRLPQFIMAGELDRTAAADNTKVFDHMMVAKFPIIYAIFTGRGHEAFPSEDGRLFDWMSRQRRQKPPLDIEIKSARTTDNQFWWWKFSNFTAKFGVTDWAAVEKSRTKPIVLSAGARRAPGSNLITIHCAAKRHSLWLFPDVVSFEKPLTIRHDNVQLYRQIPEPDLKAMLEDFRIRGDRQQIAWAYLELGSTVSAPTARAD